MASRKIIDQTRRLWAACLLLKSCKVRTQTLFFQKKYVYESNKPILLLYCALKLFNELKGQYTFIKRRFKPQHGIQCISSTPLPPCTAKSMDVASTEACSFVPSSRIERGIVPASLKTKPIQTRCLRKGPKHRHVKELDS